MHSHTTAVLLYYYVSVKGIKVENKLQQCIYKKKILASVTLLSA